MQIEIEKTQPRIYHIHLDTDTKSKKLHQKIQLELGFHAHHFTGHPEGYMHFEPTSHSSIKLPSRAKFNEIWKRATKLVEAEKRVVGYLEGEFIPVDIAIPFNPVARYFPPPFKIKRRKLDPSRGEKFRETEFHLVMDAKESDQRVIRGLYDAGLYGAYLEKSSYGAVVLTIQGHRKLIKPLIGEVICYLNEVGGVKRCTIKEEQALANELFRKKVSSLPEIIDSIERI